MFASTSRTIRAACLGGLVAISLGSLAQGAVLLNDSFADGNRNTTNLPSDSPVWVGVSTSDGGSLAVVPGAIQNVIGTSSRKNWTYFTSNNSAPDNNQPHNAVTQLNVGDVLTASMTFRLPNGATSAGTGRDFRFGVFLDPTDSRVQTDVNNDGGGATSPWADALGYNVNIILNSNGSGNNPLQLGKRTTSNTSLSGAGGAYTLAPNAGAAYTPAAATDYTLQLRMSMVSAAQMDVTASLLQGTTVLSTVTAADLGTSFGGTAIAGGLLPGSQSIYTSFDQLFFRMSSNTEAAQIDITNFKVELVPEPAALSLVGLAGLVLRRRSR